MTGIVHVSKEYIAKAARGWSYNDPSPSRRSHKEYENDFDPKPDEVEKRYKEIDPFSKEVDDLVKVIQTPEERLKDLEGQIKRIQQEIDELVENETKPTPRMRGGKAHLK